jgi:hypothetical protein
LLGVSEVFIKKVKSMKKKLIILFFALSCVSHPNYAMFSGGWFAAKPNAAPQMTAPSKGPATPAQAQAPMYKINATGPKSFAVKSSVDPIGDIVAKTLAEPSSSVSSQSAGQSSAVGSWFKMPEINVQKKSAESQSQVNASKEISVTQAPETFPSNKPYEQSSRPVPVASRSGSLTMPIENIEVIDAQSVQDGSVSQAQLLAKPSFLDAIKGRKVNSGKQNESLKDLHPVIGLPSLKFETLDAYKKALYQVEVDAEEQALKPINRKAQLQFDQQWQEVLNKYTASREKLGQTILKDRVELLKNQTKNKIRQDLISENRGAIELAKTKAIEEFTARAVKPERPVRSSGVKSAAAPLVPIQTESSVRTQGQNKMRDSIITSMINESFTPEFESAWVEDYKLDYEIQNNSQASMKNIQEAKQKYLGELRLDMYKKLTPQNNAAIKQAGQDAVASWKVAQEQNQKTISVQPKNKEVLVAPSMTLAEQLQAQIDKNAKTSRSESPTTVAINSRSASPVPVVLPVSYK